MHFVFVLFDNDGDGELNHNEFISLMKDARTRGLNRVGRPSLLLSHHPGFLTLYVVDPLVSAGALARRGARVQGAGAVRQGADEQPAAGGSLSLYGVFEAIESCACVSVSWIMRYNASTFASAPSPPFFPPPAQNNNMSDEVVANAREQARLGRLEQLRILDEFQNGKEVRASVWAEQAALGVGALQLLGGGQV